VRTSADVARPAALTVDLDRRFSVRLFDVGLACCAVEFAAASIRAAADTAARATPPQAAAPDGPVVEVLVVSGTVTDKIAPAVRALYDALPEPRRVVSFGACSNSGGPYWDSYSVTKGVDRLLPVDVYVPGCPPRPEALLDGLRVLSARLAAP
jgi:NADH-quinone oxidoreductase subunit B